MNFSAPETTRLGTPYKIIVYVMETIPQRFYRVSVKALILNEARDSFLICQEDNGKWELPGGGLEWGEDVKTCITRELQEEMGLATTWVADRPSYFFTFNFESSAGYGANVLYETTIEDTHFTPSSECVQIAFVNRETVGNDKKLFSAVQQLLPVFDSVLHRLD